MDQQRRLPANPLTPQAVFDDIDKRFTYHPPIGNQAERYQEIRDLAKAFAIRLAQLTPACREQSVALTHLDSAVFNANAAIARHEE